MSLKTNSTETLKWLVFAFLALWVAYSFTGCASLPKMERQITLYKGCPEYNGICKRLKGDVKTEFKKSMPNISSESLGEWIEINIDDSTKLKVLPANSKSFKEYIGIHSSDLGVLLKYINDLKRKVVGK
jgi:hypothetical protein